MSTFDAIVVIKTTMRGQYSVRTDRPAVGIVVRLKAYQGVSRADEELVSKGVAMSSATGRVQASPSGSGVVDSDALADV